MIKQPSISSLQIIMLAVGSALMFPYTFMPILNTYPHNQDVWVVLIVGMFYIVIINAPMLFFMIKFRGLTLNETFELIAGSIIGKICAMVFVLLYFMCYLVCLMMALDFANITLMPYTPMWALLLLAIIPITYISIRGAGVIGRLGLFVVPAILLTIIIFGLSGLEIMNLDNLKPVLADSTFLDINKGALTTACRFSEINIFFIFSYFMKKDAKIGKAYISALLIFGVSFLIMLLSTILSLGYTLASISYNPYYIFTRQVQLYETIEKLQVLNVFVWFPGSLLKLSIYSFMASYVLNQIFKKVSRPKFAIGLGILVFILGSLQAIDNTMLFKFLGSDDFFPYVIFAIVFLIPLFLFIIYLFRKKKVDNELNLKLEKIDRMQKTNTNALVEGGNKEINNQ